MKARARARAAQGELTDAIGMIVALASWTMMFGALFFLYAGMRARAPAWPPPGIPRLPLGLPALATALLLGSSAALATGVRRMGRIRRRGARALAGWTAAAIALGGGFLGVQVVVWRRLFALGLTPSTGAYASVFYGLTALHAIHVGAGLVVLFTIFARAIRGASSSHDPGRVRVAAMFWHFVDAVWALMFLALYLL